MKTKEFTGSAGKLVRGMAGQLAFEPSPLPARCQWTNSLVSSLQRASNALGRLQGLGSKFPNPQRLVRIFLRSEAEASSRIEQTYARVRTLLLFEHSPDVKESRPS